MAGAQSGQEGGESILSQEHGTIKEQSDIRADYQLAPKAFLRTSQGVLIKGGMTSLRVSTEGRNIS